MIGMREKFLLSAMIREAIAKLVKYIAYVDKETVLYWSVPLLSLSFLYNTATTRRLCIHTSSQSDPTSQRLDPMNSSASSKDELIRYIENPAVSEADKSSGMSKLIREENVRQWLNVWVSGGSYPGLMLSILKNNDEIFYHEAGYTDVEQKKLVSRDRIYRIYSMTKPITALAVLMLVDRGLILLEDYVANYLPAFKQQKVLVGGTFEEPILEEIKNPMTIHHLLTHTSGITYGIFGNNLHDVLLRDAFTAEDCRTWFTGLTSEELCDRIAQAPLSFQPGSAFLYGLSSDVLGRIIEVVTKKSLRDFFINEIFLPLGMLETDFFVKDADLDRLVACYEVLPGNQYKVSTNPERRRDQIPRLLSAGGGLVSTMDDYIKFVKFFLNRCVLSDGQTLLSETLYTAMISNQLPGNKDLVQLSIDNTFSESIGEGVGYGYGVSVLMYPEKCKGGHLSSVGEYGWGGVASTCFVIDPSKQTAVILMANLIPSSAYPIRSQLRSLYHAIADS
jgi:CubicO group peptidase (beta-lactamase class C family)